MNTKYLYQSVLIATLAMAAPAQAQNSPGDGRALDNNLQAGSGGVNTPIPQLFTGSNDLVTGNVPGLANFRDPLGYSAPGEFGDSLGSDDLFRFQAQSFGSNPNTSPNNIYTSPNQSGISLYRPFATPRTGQSFSGFSDQNAQAQTNAYKHANLIVNASSLETGVALGLIPQNITAAINKSKIKQKDLLAVTRQEDGKFLRHTASPLLGVRSAPIEEQVQAAQEIQEQAQQANQPVLGPHIHNALNVKNAPEQALENYTKQIETALFNPVLDYNVEPGKDIYNDLLNKINEHRNQRINANKDQSPPPPDQLIPQQDTNKQQDTPPAIPNAPIIVPDDEPKADPEPTNNPEPTNTTDQADNSELPTEHLPATKRLIETLDYDLPPIRTLAGNTDKQYDSLLRKAEANLAKENYFDAETNYRQAATLNPKNPLAQAGLVHAQLGSGQIRSASFNLRRLFELHPELIATRYDRKLLPTTERLAWIKKELLRMTRKPIDVEPILIQAYIAYQQNRANDLKDSLYHAHKLAPNDPLIPTLKKIWLNQK